MTSAAYYTSSETETGFYRLAALPFNTNNCFFSGSSDTKDLHKVRSLNAGLQLKHSIEASDKMQWKLHLSAAINLADTLV